MTVVGRVDPDFWAGRRVLLTGHTGFKGSWLAIWLARLGARVTGLALEPHSHPNLYQEARVSELLEADLKLDIRKPELLRQAVQGARPEVVLHLAAQPLVRHSYAEPILTFDTNVLGTVHLLDALRCVNEVKVAVIITTDKVYANHEWHWPYRECDVLGGHDPYSASKAACEIAIDCYRKSYFMARDVQVASARAGNVIGGGDWSDDRLLPDAVKAWQELRSLEIRRPDAVRPWQHVLEPLCGYLTLAQALWHREAPAEPYNFGPDAADAASVRSVIEIARQVWDGPASVTWGQPLSGPHEAGLLALDTSKSRRILGQFPRWKLREAVERSMRWYTQHQLGRPARALCHHDIDCFLSSA